MQWLYHGHSETDYKDYSCPTAAFKDGFWFALSDKQFPEEVCSARRADEETCPLPAGH